MTREIVQAHEIRELRRQLVDLTRKATQQEKLLAAITYRYGDDGMLSVSKHEMRINYELFTGCTEHGDQYHVRAKTVNPTLW